MKHHIISIALLLLGSISLPIQAQDNLFSEGKNLFEQQAYSAALSPLANYLKSVEKSADTEAQRMQAHYMLACIAYELQQPNDIQTIEKVINNYPESPYNNRLKGLMASAYFFDNDYETALNWFNQCNLDNMSPAERDDFIYRMATCYLELDELTEAASWFMALSNTSDRYEADSKYYLAYIRYTQERYDEALQSFLSLQTHPKYEALVPYYIAEIYLQKNQLAEAEKEYDLESRSRRGCRQLSEEIQPSGICCTDVSHKRSRVLPSRAIASGHRQLQAIPATERGGATTRCIIHAWLVVLQHQAIQ